jgi:hypothetical protein
MRTLVLAAAATLLVPSQAQAWGFDAHQFIVSRAIDLLPAPIRPFFEANRTFIVEHTLDPDLWRAAGFSEEPPNHFLDFDAYGRYPFKDLPREFDEALKKYGRDPLNQNGLVPWRTRPMKWRGASSGDSRRCTRTAPTRAATSAISRPSSVTTSRTPMCRCIRC